MQSIEDCEKSRFKLAQIWNITVPLFHRLRISYSRKRIINEILKDDFNVNLKFTIIDHKSKTVLVPAFDSNIICLKDYTPLHFLYHKVQDVDTFTTFIVRGADFTIKNGDGLTVLHLIIRNIHSYMGEQEFPFIKAVLSGHVKFQNSINPCDDHGITHFHGACMTNHVEAMELFLENGASIHEAVNDNAPRFAGWTPLHFAAASCSFKVAQILVERGANVNAQTAEGEGPLDRLIGDYDENFSIQDNNADQDQFVKLLLGKGAVSSVGLTTLHIACTLNDLTMAERLLNEGADIEYAVPKKSPIHPGNTALHFAAGNSIEAVKMLLKRGAKIDVANARGVTPFELCKTNCSLPNLCSILSCIESLKAVLHGQRLASSVLRKITVKGGKIEKG